jgi:hypothetical protein
LLASSLAILQTTAPLGRLDETWLRSVRVLNPYLYVSSWSLSDWSRVVTALALLPIGLLTGLTPAVRRVCAGALITGACGLLITALYCDLLHVTIFTELQSWRWLWLTDVIAVLLAPVIVRDCWQSGGAGRTAIVLLGSAWLLRGDGAALCIVCLAIACAAAPAGWREHRYTKVLFLGSWALLATVAAIDMVDKFAYVPVESTDTPPVLQQLRLVCADGVIPAALLLAAWQGLRWSRSRGYSIALIGAGALACAALVPPSWASWTKGYFAPALRAQLAPWRTEIPLHAEVMWPGTPIGAWYLLERPSYWSTYQLAGGIFSRQKSLFLQQRTAAMNAALGPSGLTQDHPGVAKEDLPVLADTSKMTADGLVRACGDPDLRYVVSWLRLGKTRFAPITPDPIKPLSRLYLYRCADFRT